MKLMLSQIIFLINSTKIHPFYDLCIGSIYVDDWQLLSEAPCSLYATTNIYLECIQ